MPGMYAEGSYAELELRLAELRESRLRPLWWNACARYRWGILRTIVCPVVRRITGPDFRLPRDHDGVLRCELVAGGPAVGAKAALARIYQWSDDVDEQRAADGITVLATLMYEGRKHNIVLPQDVLNRALGRPVVEREAVAV